MAMLKSKCGKWGGSKGSCAGLQNYLEKEGRSLAFDCSAQVGFEAEWGLQMDLDRVGAAKDKGRKFYHFMISPDPNDKISLEGLRELAVSWVEENYPGSQWAIDYHDDNKREIMHAHVAINAYDPSSGMKIHRSNRKIEEEANSLQELCGLMGLSALPRLKVGKSRTSRDVRLSKAEIELRDKGITSYKEKLRRSIDECAGRSASFEEFVVEIERLGITCHENRRGQIVYKHPDPGSYPCKGEKLGAGYVREAVAAKLRTDLGSESRKLRSARIPEAAIIPKKATPRFASMIGSRPASRKTVETLNVAQAIRHAERLGVTSASELERELGKARESLRNAEDSLATYRDTLSILREAANRIDLLRSEGELFEAYEQARTGLLKARIARKAGNGSIEACLDAESYLKARGLFSWDDYDRIEQTIVLATQRLGDLDKRVEKARQSLSSLEAVSRIVSEAKEAASVRESIGATRSVLCVRRGKPAFVQRASREGEASRHRLSLVASQLARASMQRATRTNGGAIVSRNDERGRGKLSSAR